MVGGMDRRTNLVLEEIRAELAAEPVMVMGLRFREDEPRPDEPPAEDDGTGDEMPEPGEDIPIDEIAVYKPIAPKDWSGDIRRALERPALRDLPPDARKAAETVLAFLFYQGHKKQVMPFLKAVGSGSLASWKPPAIGPGDGAYSKSQRQEFERELKKLIAATNRA
jgi:hypothetical protein